MGAAVSLLCVDGLFTVLYLLGVNVDVDCGIKAIPVMTFVIASKPFFIPTCGLFHSHCSFIFLQTDQNHQSNHDHHNHLVDGSNSSCNNPMH